LSCSDYKITSIPEPDIEVLSLEIDFEALSSGYEDKSLPITITNIGSDKLIIDRITLVTGDSTFTLEIDEYDSTLSPSQSTIVSVNFRPITFSSNAEKLQIHSNDPDEPIVEVALIGTGDAPVIYVDPDYYSFYEIYAGCSDSSPITIGNLGSVDLVIEDVTHFSSLPANFEMADYEPYYGMLPIIVVPGDSITLEVNYFPTDAFFDDGFIEILSNDPLNEKIYSDHDGNGDYERWITDEFEQDETRDVDILFVIDNSGSMSSNHSNFVANFSSFIAVFSGSGVDYRIAFITTDDPTIVGSIVSPTDPDPVSTVGSIITSIGTGGSPHEAGLWYSYESLLPGGSAGAGGSFFRNDAKLVVIYVSDEPDHSSSYSPMSTTDYETYFRSLKVSNLLAVHAVAGDYPAGCTGNGGAQFGDGYFDVVTSLGGTFLSICDSDWGTAMDTLARDSVLRSSFMLTDKPVEGTISVEIDGVLSTDWYYDSFIQALYFSIVPAPGSIIRVTYAVWSCQGEG